jgi:hypothetical protein
VWLFGVEPQEIEELPDLVIHLRRMPHSNAPVELVPVAPALALSRHVPGVDEIRDDSLRGTLRDTHRLRDVTQPNPGIALKAQKHLRVTREKVPTLRFRT